MAARPAGFRTIEATQAAASATSTSRRRKRTLARSYLGMRIALILE